jgi:hypothetical protein
MSDMPTPTAIYHQERQALIQKWYDEHGELPRLVLGYRRHPEHGPSLFCLDHGDTGTPILTGDDEGEGALCVICGRHLRGADRFGDVSQVDLGVDT